MTTLLAYFPSPPRGVWHLGPIPIRAYALFIIVGIVVALLIGDRRWESRGGERGVIYDIALWAVPFGLVGGRLYHLATDWRTYFGSGGAGLGAALRIWDGGLGIWGAVALGGVGAWIACRRRGIPLPAFADAVAPGIVLAQAIGRLGNYFNQELYGRETTMPWGMEVFYRRDPSGFVDVHSLEGASTGQVALVVQPTFLYELLWNVLIFVILIYVDRRFAIGHGRLFALYVAGYCVGRFWIELLRDDPATHIAGIRINSFTSTFVFIGAVVYLILAPKGREDPDILGGTRHAEESAVTEPVSVAAAASASSGAAAAKVADGEDVDESVESGETFGSAKAEKPEPEEAEREEAIAEKTEPAPEEAEELLHAEAEAEETGPEEVETEVPEYAQAVAEGAEPADAATAEEEPEPAEAATDQPEAPVDADAEADANRQPTTVNEAGADVEGEEPAVAEADAHVEAEESDVEQAAQETRAGTAGQDEVPGSPTSASAGSNARWWRDRLRRLRPRSSR